jgi:hypothetical protein
MSKKPAANPPSSPTTAAKHDTLFLGVDWADQKHDFCLLTAKGEVLRQDVIKHHHKDITAFLRDAIAMLKPEGRIQVACESAVNALGRYLRDFDRVDLRLVHPGSFCNYRESCRNSKAKDDKMDAFLLADYLRRHLDKLPIYAKGQENELEITGRLRRTEVDHRADHYNRMTSALKMIFPGLLAVANIKSSSLLTILALWPTLQDLQSASHEEIYAKLEGKRLHKATIQKLLQLRDEGRFFVTELTVVGGCRSQVRVILRHLETANAIIAELEARINELVLADSKLFQLMSSLPGAGKALAPRLVAAFSNLPENMTFEEFAAMSGIVPVLISSGKSRLVKMRMSGRGFTCQTFFEFADHSWKHSQWAAEHYQNQRAKKSKHGTAVRSVALKWLRIIWAMVKSGQPYDEPRYLAARAAKQAS